MDGRGAQEGSLPDEVSLALLFNLILIFGSFRAFKNETKQCPS